MTKYKLTYDEARIIVMSLIWYNNDGGRTDDDFEVEDILQHYREQSLN